ncbi:hypothetical protein EST38_g13654 [Candolleomyces aberdarensis]|uniref:Uncharacterized protein n=1 Tax=Candolleomyces aberdarensis TaxID=2316362 RepID=A0A4Q2CZ90_9AGAR|nr:hypothetical protein EST38_g13654 [Candolleomyces aberdarensis]
MDDDSSSLFTDQDAESQFYLTDISLDHTDDAANGDHGSLDMTELVIFGLTDAPDGKSFPLVKASQRRWNVEASIELPKCAEGIEIITKSKEGWDNSIAFGNTGGWKKTEKRRYHTALPKYSTPSFVSATIASKTASCRMPSVFSILMSKDIGVLTTRLAAPVTEVDVPEDTGDAKKRCQ